MSPYGRPRLGFGGGLTDTVKYLLVINVAVYILQHYVEPIEFYFMMRPVDVLTRFHIWQLFSYMFLHGSFLHLLFNMFALWMFGCEVERVLGSREFTKYYLVCGIGAGLFHMVFNYESAVLGASGAIYGLLVAFAVLFPERVITLLLFLVLPVQIKAKYFVMIFAGISLMGGILGSDDPVAYFAHLGGMVIGFAYLKLDWRLNYVGNWLRQQRESRQAVSQIKQQQDMQIIRARVDEILDKINEVGYEALNAEEKRILQEASQKFSQEPEPEN